MTERAARLRPDALSCDQARVYEHITGGPRSKGPRAFDITDADGALLGPFNAMLSSPQVGDRLQALGAALRYESGLPDRVREAIILVVAAHHGSAFERYAHEATGRQVGLTSRELEILRDARPANVFTEPAEQSAVDAAHQLLTRGDCDDDCFAALDRHYGKDGVFEIATLVGYYSLLAMQLRLFRADQEPRSRVLTGEVDNGQSRHRRAGAGRCHRRRDARGGATSRGSGNTEPHSLIPNTDKDKTCEQP